MTIISELLVPQGWRKGESVLALGEFNGANRVHCIMRTCPSQYDPARASDAVCPYVIAEPTDTEAQINAWMKWWYAL